MTEGVRRNALSSLATIAANAPAGYEMLRWVGLERRRSRVARVATSAGWFGAGVALGSGLALLLTPHSGPEMRRKLSRQARRARDYVADEANGIGRSVQPHQ
jgi:hypothetical protein